MSFSSLASFTQMYYIRNLDKSCGCSGIHP